jgi:hypothetical protein
MAERGFTLLRPNTAPTTWAATDGLLKNRTSPTSAQEPPTAQRHNGLIIGLSVGILPGLAFLAVLIYSLMRRKWKRRRTVDTMEHSKPGLGAKDVKTPLFEIDVGETHELEGDLACKVEHEMDSARSSVEKEIHNRPEAGEVGRLGGEPPSSTA